MALARYEELLSRAETIVRRLLVTDDYDSVSNFISLYDTLEASGAKNLREFFPRYAPPIRPHKHTCVGLGLELIKRLRALDSEFPGLSNALALVSCEEAIPDVREYASEGLGPEDFAAEVEKEHVMVAVHVRVDGRVGVMLTDPGYHVARVVTVMADRCYPQTGWFTQSEEPHSTKEYMYSFNLTNGHYVEWNERDTRDGAVKFQTSLVYVYRPYLDGVNVTERRNLVYNFRSLLKRDQKGHLVAGLYFPVAAKDARFTLFYEGANGKQKTKLKFSTFLNDPEKIPDSVMDEVYLCNSHMQYKDGELLQTISRLAGVMSNNTFINQLLSINDDICQITSVI